MMRGVGAVDNPTAKPATDTLRDRIAAVIEEERNQWAGGDAASETLANAVIEALALRQEYDPYSEPELSRHRYVTEWETDE